MNNFNELNSVLDMNEDSNFNTNVEEIKKLLDGALIVNLSEDQPDEQVTNNGLDVNDPDYLFDKDDSMTTYNDYIRERKLIEFTFGKGGAGISDELIKIGERIKTLSKDYKIYLEDSLLNPLDDNYTLIFELNERD